MRLQGGAPEPEPTSEDDEILVAVKEESRDEEELPFSPFYFIDRLGRRVPKWIIDPAALLGWLEAHSHPLSLSSLIEEVGMEYHTDDPRLADVLSDVRMFIRSLHTFNRYFVSPRAAGNNRHTRLAYGLINLYE